MVIVPFPYTIQKEVMYIILTKTVYYNSYSHTVVRNLHPFDGQVLVICWGATINRKVLVGVAVHRIGGDILSRFPVNRFCKLHLESIRHGADSPHFERQLFIPN